MKWVMAAIATVALSLLATPAALADSAGLVAAYGFEEASGTTAVDSSPAGNAGVLNGAVRSASGRFGAAASFDGVNDRVDVADSASLDLTAAMTLEAWVRPTALNWRTAILKERPGGLAYALYGSTDTNRASAEIQAETRAPSAIATNTWTHLAATYDGATLRLYVNGTQASSRAVSGPITVSSGALRIGGNAVWGEYFKGLIDEVRVYNRALTAGEIQTDMGTAVVAADAQPPVLSVNAACDGSTLSEFVGPITGTATDAGGNVTVRVEVDGTQIWASPSFTGPFSFNWDTRTVANGPHVMKVTARDAAGNETVKDCPWTVANSALSVPITGVAGGDTVTGTVSIGFQPRSDGQPATAPARLVLDGVTVADTGLGPYTYSWDTTTLANGVHTLKSEMFWRDYPNPMASATIQVTVNNPTSQPSPPTGVAASVSGDDVNVTWDAVAGATAYRVLRDGSDIAFVEGTSYTDADRPPGTYDYTVVAVFMRSESAPSAKATATVTLNDTTPPSVSFDSGCNGAKVHDYLDLRPLVSDDHGPMTARVLVDGATIWGPFTVSGPRMQFNWETRSLANGPHLMTVVVRDGAGNETSAPCEWNVQNPVVTVPFGSPANGATVSGTVNLTAQALADGQTPDWSGYFPTWDPVTAVSFEVVGASSGSDSVAPYQFAWDTTKVPNGTYTLRARVSWMDYSLPRATSEIQVTVDNPVAPPPSGLVAAYGFEQTSGASVTDSSGKGSVGTISGATWAAGGKFGRALSFDGVNDLVTMPDSNLLDLAPGMTLEAWVKPTTVSDWRTVLLKERPGQLAYALYAAGEGGRPMAEVSAGTQRDARGTAALAVGTWSHVAATYDKTTLRLYVNGTLVASTAVSGALVNSTGALRIGGNSIWGEYFGGLIDEVRVYERALSAAEINADKARAVVP